MAARAGGLKSTKKSNARAMKNRPDERKREKCLHYIVCANKSPAAQRALCLLIGKRHVCGAHESNRSLGACQGAGDTRRIKNQAGFSDWWGHYFSMTAAAVFLATDKANKTQCESSDIKWLLMELPVRALGCCETLRRDSKSSAGNSSHIPSSTVEWFHSGSHTAKSSSAHGEPCKLCLTMCTLQTLVRKTIYSHPGKVSYDLVSSLKYMEK